LELFFRNSKWNDLNFGARFDVKGDQGINIEVVKGHFFVQLRFLGDEINKEEAYFLWA